MSRRAGRRWRRTWTGRSWFWLTMTKTTKVLREVKMTVGGWLEVEVSREI